MAEHLPVDLRLVVEAWDGLPDVGAGCHRGDGQGHGEGA